MPRRCYDCDTNTASYLAHLAWTAGPMLLCHDCAAWEREGGNVITIRSMDRGHR